MMFIFRVDKLIERSAASAAWRATNANLSLPSACQWDGSCDSSAGIIYTCCASNCKSWISDFSFNTAPDLAAGADRPQHRAASAGTRPSRRSRSERAAQPGRSLAESIRDLQCTISRLLLRRTQTHLDTSCPPPRSGCAASSPSATGPTAKLRAATTLPLFRETRRPPRGPPGLPPGAP